MAHSERPDNTLRSAYHVDDIRGAYDKDIYSGAR
jgi:hypothetical protein